MYRLHPRGSASRGVTVDAEGVMLGPDCDLVRRTPAGYRCVTEVEAATIQSVLSNRVEDPDWLFWQCCRIANALDGGNIALAQIHGVQIPTVDLDSVQLEQLASIALCVKANFDPNQPRDAHGRWTDADSSENRVPPSSVPAASPRPGHTIVTPQDGTHVTVQLAADNQRENKMVRDIVVQLRLDRAQRQQLHREISGQGYTYQEILQVAKEIFGK